MPIKANEFGRDVIRKDGVVGVYQPHECADADDSDDDVEAVQTCHREIQAVEQLAYVLRNAFFAKVEQRAREMVVLELLRVLKRFDYQEPERAHQGKAEGGKLLVLVAGLCVVHR